MDWVQCSKFITNEKPVLLIPIKNKNTRMFNREGGFLAKIKDKDKRKSSLFSKVEKVRLSSVKFGKVWLMFRASLQVK